MIMKRQVGTCEEDKKEMVDKPFVRDCLGGFAGSCSSFVVSFFFDSILVQWSDKESKHKRDTTQLESDMFKSNRLKPTKR